MGSNYFGEQNYGNERSVSSSSSSRKGKKSNPDKPKQPQRGLGVAQLEKIRLHSQMGCNYLPSVHNPYAGPNTSFGQEDMRLQTAYSSSSQSTTSYGFAGPHGSMIGYADLDRGSIRYGDSQPSSTIGWHQSSSMLGTQHFSQPSTTKHFLNPEAQDFFNKKSRNERMNDSMGSSSQNSESSGTQEIDLELRLSL